MRIAVLLKSRCKPKNCSYECIKFCPRVRAGDETIIKGEDGRTDLVRQFGKNGFRLFRLPIPKIGSCTGILGPNGIGKTTAIRILSGQITPNLGKFNENIEFNEVLEYYSGTELFDHFKKIANNEISAIVKPQYVDKLPKIMKGKIKDILKKSDNSGNLDKIIEKLNLNNILDKDINKGEISGGELQLTSIAAALLKDADIYFFDEPTSYLDIHQRLKIAKIIKELSEEKKVLVVGHDLAVLDFLCDNVNLLYGDEGAYGVVTNPITYEKLEKKFKDFNLIVENGILRKGEIIGILGPNAIGKTTFVKMLAGEIQPTKGKIEYDIKVSYKPQYISPDFNGTVRDFLEKNAQLLFTSNFYKTEILEKMNLKYLFDKSIETLSGGELQRVAISNSLVQDVDIYLIDEPSAYLDSEQRMITSRIIRRVIEKLGKSAMIVDHDVYFIDMISDSLVVFDGEPGNIGRARGPYSLHEGMNRFLKDVNITFRRDEETHRPRVNKIGSYMDRKQRQEGEYYYSL